MCYWSFTTVILLPTTLSLSFLPLKLQIKNKILSVERSVKEFIFGPKKKNQESEIGKLPTNAAEKHP